MTDRIETLVTRLAEGAPYDGPPMMARRAAVVVPGTWDEAKRTLRYVFSRGAIVRRRIVDWFGDTVDEFDEELVIEPGSVRLGRLNAGAPFLDSHDSDGLGANLLGKIVEIVRPRRIQKIRGDHRIAEDIFNLHTEQF